MQKPLTANYAQTECQFRDMHTAIVKNFKKYHLFGFTGTPIFSVNSGRARKKQGVIDKLKNFFEKYFGIGGSSTFTKPVTYDIDSQNDVLMVAENTTPYGN